MLGVAVATRFGGDSLVEALQYDRDAIASGELWRLATGHFVHLGWTHLGLNAVGVGILAMLAPTIPAQRLLARLGVLLIGLSLALWTFCPALDWYVGLSGTLHGLAVLIALDLWGRHAGIGPVILIGTGSKLLWESAAGSATSIDLGGAVAVEAHFWGAATGLAAGLIERWRTVSRDGPREPCATRRGSNPSS